MARLKWLAAALLAELVIFTTPASAAGPANAGSITAGPLKVPGVAASVGPLLHIVQTVNNCGPASVAEVLHFWGIDKSQGELSAILRHGNPIGMSTDDLADYLPTIGMAEYIGNHGTQGVIKELLANGFPVIVSQFVSSRDLHTHFRAIDSYDDEGQYFVSSDPLLEARHRISYKEFDQIWVPYDQTFVVIFPPDKRQALETTLARAAFDGPSWMTPLA